MHMSSVLLADIIIIFMCTPDPFNESGYALFVSMLSLSLSLTHTNMIIIYTHTHIHTQTLTSPLLFE